MKIAVTGGTGFIGRYILRELSGQGHSLRAWKRDGSDVSSLDDVSVEWMEGNLENEESIKQLVKNCDAVVHAALWKPGDNFRGGEGDVARFAEVNVVGSLRLISSARDAGVDRFVYLSSCAVHEVILDDRPLDEAHPCWASTHYGAHKAAVEKFVHSFALGHQFNICALRPTGVYGLSHPANQSKWYDLIGRVSRGESVEVSGGGKEVHAGDVARSVSLLLDAQDVAGQAFNCYDRYISRYEVASIARQITGSESRIDGQSTAPKHQIETQKIRGKGMAFGGESLLRATIKQIVTTL